MKAGRTKQRPRIPTQERNKFAVFCPEVFKLPSHKKRQENLSEKRISYTLRLNVGIYGPSVGLSSIHFSLEFGTRHVVSSNQTPQPFPAGDAQSEGLNTFLGHFDDWAMGQQKVFRINGFKMNSPGIHQSKDLPKSFHIFYHSIEFAWAEWQLLKHNNQAINERDRVNSLETITRYIMPLWCKSL